MWVFSTTRISLFLLLFSYYYFPVFSQKNRINLVKIGINVSSQQWKSSSPSNFTGMHVGYERALVYNSWAPNINIAILTSGSIYLDQMAVFSGGVNYYFQDRLDKSYGGGGVGFGIPQSGAYTHVYADGGYKIKITPSLKLEFFAVAGYGSWFGKTINDSGLYWSAGASVCYKFLQR